MPDCLHKFVIDTALVLDQPNTQLVIRCERCQKPYKAFAYPRRAEGADIKGFTIETAAEVTRSGSQKSPKSIPIPEYLADREAKGAGPLPGTEALWMFHRMSLGWCHDCTLLADKMDAWGADGCRKPENFSYIIVDSLPRAMKNWEAIKKQAKQFDAEPLTFWWKAWGTSPIGAFEMSKIVGAFADSEAKGVEALIRALFTHAIDAAEQKYEDKLGAEAEAAVGPG